MTPQPITSRHRKVAREVIHRSSLTLLYSLEERTRQVEEILANEFPEKDFGSNAGVSSGGTQEPQISGIGEGMDATAASRSLAAHSTSEPQPAMPSKQSSVAEINRPILKEFAGAFKILGEEPQQPQEEKCLEENEPNK